MSGLVGIMISITKAKTQIDNYSENLTGRLTF